MNFRFEFSQKLNNKAALACRSRFSALLRTAPFCRTASLNLFLYNRGRSFLLYKKSESLDIQSFHMVEGDGFEPSKQDATDLQSAPFGHSGTPPYLLGAGGRTRTPDLLITNQLLCQLSYTSL